MEGLALHTDKIFESISRLECIKPFVLVGGTALSLQIGNRLSEDLDFMSWRKSKMEKREIDWPAIKKELEMVGTIEKMEIYGLDHVEFVVDGVKISFYASPNYSPVNEIVPCHNNLVLADLLSIAAMKMEVMLRRSKFRDYYDIYSLVKIGVDIKDAIDLALRYSGHRLKSKFILSMLSNGSRFTKDSNFDTLSPIYDVNALDIEQTIKEILKRDFNI